MIKEAIIFAAGAAVGSVVAWQILKKEYQLEAQEEVQSMELYYKNKYGEIPPATKVEEKPATPKNVDIPVGDKTEPELFSGLPRNVYRNYGNRQSVDEILKAASELPDEEPPKEPRLEPYIITPEEYNNRSNKYEQISITYYEGDDTLIEDDGHPHPADEIDEMGGFRMNIDEYVGRDNLENPDDDDVIYIRNERLGVDFEVNIDPRSYNSDILGYIMPGVNKPT